MGVVVGSEAYGCGWCANQHLFDQSCMLLNATTADTVHAMLSLVTVDNSSVSALLCLEMLR